jgi:DNA-binding NarL/FixJ family response regulator
MVRTAALKTSAIWSTEDEEMLLIMRTNGMSFRQIAEALGLSQASVETRHSSLKKGNQAGR